MEMTFKQAHNEMRQVIKALRPFEKLEAVLAAADMAEQTEAAVKERVRALTESADKWEAAVEEARETYAAEGAAVLKDAERRKDEFAAGMAQMKLDGDASKQAHDTAIAEALSAGERKRDALTAKCRALEEQRETLEGKLKQARDEYAAMLKKLGVTNG